MPTTWLFALIPLAVLVAVPAFWCGVVWVISQFGWGRLAKAYATDLPRTGRTFRFVSGAIGMSNYSNALTVSIEPEGLRLAVPFLFRVGHPPLLLPWDEIQSIERQKVLWHTSYAIRPAAEGATTIRLPERVIVAIRDAAPGI